MKTKKSDKKMSAIVNSRTGKLMSSRALRQWWKQPVSAKDLVRG